ncbi:hypothetical protein Pla108_16860 [Botrimarina colliarenosi]|uniref:Alpha/beta hydrolase family protein n=1 Tax=Botrimarina colliarenosi TaxID=2528001 RepID=A0A5C6ARG6_9BACT|nr:hypothetical protein [Botrimarina colliarenosi]TWU00734.1 hypothetical protein Pla108_16860 [Botrimarina colliarenosi]
MTKPVTQAAVAFFVLASAATAQLPVATGREIALDRPQWKLFIPATYEPRAGGAVDRLIHFHGDPQTVWNNAAYAKLNAVVVTVNYPGLSSVYSTPFSDPALFETLSDAALAKLRSEDDFGAAAHWDHLTVSSFSAGYGAVREILKQPRYRDAIDVLLAADSLYASTDENGTPVDAQMVDYKTFAELAAAGKKTFTFTHSDVATPTYESTRATGDELLAHLGLTATAIDRPGLGPLRFTRTASRGGFTLWGAAGDTGEDHMAHLRYLAEWLGDENRYEAEDASP